LIQTGKDGTKFPEKRMQFALTMDHDFYANCTGIDVSCRLQRFSLQNAIAFAENETIFYFLFTRLQS
jgi:hypothetical protein